MDRDVRTSGSSPSLVVGDSGQADLLGVQAGLHASHDDPQILRALRINLAARGYHVLVAGDGSSALRVAADGHPDVVVLDLGLPDRDGTEVMVRRGRAAGPAARGRPEGRGVLGGG